MRVRWTINAADDLARIVERIREDNPDTAQRVARTIYEGVALFEPCRTVAALGLRKIVASWSLHRCLTLRFMKLLGIKCKYFAATPRRTGLNTILDWKCRRTQPVKDSRCCEAFLFPLYTIHLDQPQSATSCLLFETVTGLAQFLTILNSLAKSNRQSCKLMYMALHSADPEVAILLTKYVKIAGMSETEAFRQNLHDAMQQEARKQKKSKFREVAYSIMEKAKQENQPPHTKEEADALFEGTGE